MTNLPPFRRYENADGTVSYEVLSSKGKYYYTVELLAGKAIACECKHRQFQPTCSHGDIAEREEKAYQASLQASSTPCRGTLNDVNKPFSVLRT